MHRFELYILHVTAITIVTGCVAPGATTSDGEDFAFAPSVEGSKAELSSNIPSSRPPQIGVTAELDAPATVAIDVNSVKAALGDPNVLAKLRDVALQASARAGVAQPTKMHAVVASDHQAAESVLSGSLINDHSPVYVIRVTGGRFVALRHPPGVAAPQGSVLTITVDATTFRVTDIGLVEVEPDLSRIGPTTVDLGAP
jgi:hypothetical protein